MIMLIKFYGWVIDKKGVSHWMQHDLMMFVLYL